MEVESTDSNQRVYPRLRAVVFYRLSRVQTKKPVRDISPFGVGIDSYDELSKGDQLEVKLVFLGGESLSVQAQVAWRADGEAGGPHRFGMIFLGLSQPQRTLIEKNILQSSDEKPPLLQRLAAPKTKPTNPEDLRSSKRNEARAHCWLGRQRTPCVLRDVSKGGISVQSGRSVKPGTNTHFEVLFPDTVQAILGEGTVTWCAPVGGKSKKFNLGLQFQEISEYDRVLLELRFADESDPS